jgi:hypothetical protein
VCVGGAGGGGGLGGGGGGWGGGGGGGGGGGRRPRRHGRVEYLAQRPSSNDVLWLCQHETICIDGHRLLCSPRLDGVSQRNVGTEVIGSHSLVRHGRCVSVALEMIQKSSALVP